MKGSEVHDKVHDRYMFNQHVPYLKPFVHKAFRRFEVYVSKKNEKQRKI